MRSPLADRIRLLAPAAVAAGASVGFTEALLHGDSTFDAVVATVRSGLVLGPSVLFGLLIAAALVTNLVERAHSNRAESVAAWILGGTFAVSATAAIASGIHGVISGTGHHSVSPFEHAIRDGFAVAPAAIAVLSLAAFVGVDPTRPHALTRLNLRRASLLESIQSGKLRRLTGAAVLSTAVLGTVTLAPVTERVAGAQTATGTPAPGTPSVRCNAATANRRYSISAINVDIPFNRWGDHNPNGLLFALDGDVSALKNWSLPLNANPAKDPANNRRLRPRPLVLRGNVGECVAVTVTNRLDMVQGDQLPNDPRVAVQPFGIAYDARTSAPGQVGHNADRLLTIGKSTTQYWKMPAVESTHLFRDIAAAAGSEGDGGSAVHGLYGAIVAEPAGSTWLDPISNKPLYTGTTTQSGELYVQASIVPPTGNAFREAVMLGQDEMPHGGGFGFNYGAEQGTRRELYKCPDCLGEETSLSSWPYGDPALVKLASGQGPWAPPGKDLIFFTPPIEPFAEPGVAGGSVGNQVIGGNVVGAGTGGAVLDPGAEVAPKIQITGTAPNPLKKGDSQENCGITSVSCWSSNVVHTYKGDPTKIRFGMAGAYETHVFHLHAHQWLAEPLDVGAAGTNPTRPTTTAKAASSIIDSQTFGPWEAFTADILFGSGNQSGTIGDSIFHCHLYAHFAEGFWALLRTHDVNEDGTGETPDRIRVNTLQPLPKRAPLVTPTAANPGYPRFLPGKTGWRSPQPPYAVSKDGKWEPRIVAGKALTPADTSVERNVQSLGYAGKTPKPGAPVSDPCPAGSREVNYQVTAIQLDIVYNSAGWHDTQGRVLVPTADVAAIRAGTKKPEPLFFRVNTGDCINFAMTNELPNFLGNDAFLKLVQTNMVGQHIHLVKFDVLGSDGSSNGWNYQQAAFTADQVAFNKRVMAGQEPCNEVVGCRIAEPADWDPNNPPPAGRGQTIHERWYANSELHTVFTHDHHFAAVAQQRGHYGALIVEPTTFDTRHPTTGKYLQPLNNPARGTVCTTTCTGTAFGAQADMVGPGAKDDFREFGLAMADWVSLVRKGGDARTREGVIEANESPELLPKDDPGVRTINYRSAPLTERVQQDGSRIDPAYAFSSYVWGDPETPLLQAYSGDNVRFRLIQGSQEEQHSFTVHGQRWRKEIDDPTSPIVNSQTIGISEAFNIDIRNIGCGPTRPRCNGDFLYGGADTQDLTDGAWGILRIHDGKVPGLLPLPDNVPAANRTTAMPAAKSRTSPPRAPQGVCPAGVPVRHYDVVAVRTDAAYDPQGSHDPYGLVFTTPQLAPIVKAGGRVEPLVLRAAEGECIEATLTNEIDPGFLVHSGEADGDATMYKENSPLGNFTLPGGLRVSLHPQLVSYDVTRGDGASVGFNGDQSVAPGERFTYRWYADDVAYGELGATTLSSIGDVNSHRHHGLLAALVVEPKGSSWVDPHTGAANTTRPNANVRIPGAKDFREHVIMYQDGLNLRDQAGTPFPDAYSRDTADRGEVGINYSRAGFPQRLNTFEIDRMTPDADTLAGVFSSVRHDDPWTPLIEAEAGDQLRVRVLQTADRSRHHAFALTGHGWFTAPGNTKSRYTGVQGGISVLGAFNIETTAGGGIDAAGDYLYGDFFGKQNLSGGSWGLLRVHPRGSSSLKPLDVEVP